MASFPKASRNEWTGDQSSGKTSSRVNNEAVAVTQKSPVPIEKRREKLQMLVTALKEKPNISNAEAWPERPSSADGLSNDACHGVPQKPLSARRLVHQGHHENHPHHTHTMVDDHLKAPIDHSKHWHEIVLASRPHKRDVMEKSLQHLKKNDDTLERLKEYSATNEQNEALMSRIAGHIVNVIEEETTASNVENQRRKPTLRTAKSLKRDAAIEKLTRVMMDTGEHKFVHKEFEKSMKHAEGRVNKEEDCERAKREEQQEEDHESWKMLAFDGSPAKKRERRDTYTVFFQRRRKSLPKTPGRERKGKHPLDLIGVTEVVPHTPPRAQSVEGHSRAERITVHASDFMKYGDDVETLRMLKVESPSPSEPAAVEGMHESTVHGKVSRSSRGSSGSPPVSRPRSQPPSRPASQPSSARKSSTGPGRPHAGTWPPSQPPPRASSARTARPGRVRRHLEGQRNLYSAQYCPFLPMKLQAM